MLRQADASGALHLHETARGRCRAAGDRSCEALALGGMGMAHSALGDRRKAVEVLEEALRLQGATSDRLGEAGTLVSLGFFSCQGAILSLNH